MMQKRDCVLTLEKETYNNRLFIEIECGGEIPRSLQDIILIIAREGSKQLSKDDVNLIETFFREDIAKLEEWKRVEVKKALINSQVGIRIKSSPQLQFNGIFQLPKEFVNFTGRIEERDKIEQNFRRHRGIIQKLAGTGGIGKTQLANNYARLKLIENFYQWVVWFHIGEKDNDEKILEQFIDLGKRLGIDTNANQGKRLVELVYIQLSQRGRGLVVMDDVTDYIKIKEYLPNQSLCNNNINMIMTSRNIIIWGTEIVNVNLDNLGLVYATQYIKRVMVSRKFEERAAEKLAECLGCFPLALTQALAYINNTPITILDYIREFIRSKEAQKALLKSLLFADDDHQVTAYVTIRMSREKIKNQYAWRLLDKCAYMMPESPIYEEMLSTWIEDVICRNTAIILLKQYSLLEDFGHDSSLKIHKLVQDVVRLGHKPNEESSNNMEIRKDIARVRKRIVESKPGFEGNNKVYNLTNHEHHSLLGDTERHVKDLSSLVRRMEGNHRTSDQDNLRHLNTPENIEEGKQRYNLNIDNIRSAVRTNERNTQKSVHGSRKPDEEEGHSYKDKSRCKCCCDRIYSFSSYLLSWFKSENVNQNKASMKVEHKN